jgi:hypothetical protein
MLELLGWIVLLFAIASLPYLIARRPVRLRFPGVSAELRAQLGEGLAGLLVATRKLREEIVAFEQIAHRMLAGELAERLPSGHRAFTRDMADASFLVDVRTMRRAGQAWLEQVAATPEADRQRFGIELDALSGLFDLPWTCEHGDAPVNDRSVEIRALIEGCHAAADALARIDAALGAASISPYR